jgi:hypothetical protein
MNETHLKILSSNDTGETGSNQSGITIPIKNTNLVKFFPHLDKKMFNPETWIYCEDKGGVTWKMRYIYYNGRSFSPPRSTRNEFRITHITKFLKKWSARSGDMIIFSATSKKNYYKISIQESVAKLAEPVKSRNSPIKLRGWSQVC